MLPSAEVLLEHLQAGELQREVGARYGVSAEAVSDAMRRAGYRRVAGKYVKSAA